MRKNNGITLISLVITVTVLIILASIATYSGVNVIRQSKLNRFITEMKIMQTEVNSLYDKYSNGTEEEKADILNYGKALDSEASNVFTTNASGITDSSGYKYYDKTTIETLGIENVEEEFYVNVEKRSVVSRLGIEYKGEKYYTLEQVPSGLYNVEYEDRNTEKPTFDITKEKLENGKYKITISNIQYDGYIEKWEVKYRLQGESNWSTSEDLSFIVSKNGTYEIKLVNGSVESEEKEVEASKETIDETTSYVANYLDIDYDEEADGIIYADLEVGRSGQWIDSSGIYSYEAKKGLKEYYIENENYIEEKFGDVRGKLIAPAKGSSGEERFFIMALDDIKSGTRFC